MRRALLSHGQQCLGLIRPSSRSVPRWMPKEYRWISPMPTTTVRDLEDLCMTIRWTRSRVLSAVTLVAALASTSCGQDDDDEAATGGSSSGGADNGGAPSTGG